MNMRIAMTVVWGVSGIFLFCAWAAEPASGADQFAAQFAGLLVFLPLLASVSIAAEKNSEDPITDTEELIAATDKLRQKL